MDNQEIYARVLVDYFLSTEDLCLSAHGLLSWLQTHVKPAYEKRIEYLAGIVSRGGVEALKAKPQIIIGTIHSVKGGEAEVVYLCPDLSPQGYNALEHSPDEITRQFYVGMTRCKESLIIADPTGNAFVDLESFV